MFVLRVTFDVVGLVVLLFASAFLLSVLRVLVFLFSFLFDFVFLFEPYQNDWNVTSVSCLCISVHFLETRVHSKETRFKNY